MRAAEVEKRAGKPLMSGFHALFSIGGFLGSVLMTGALSAKIGALTGTVVAAVPMTAALLIAAPELHRDSEGRQNTAARDAAWH